VFNIRKVVTNQDRNRTGGQLQLLHRRQLVPYGLGRDCPIGTLPGYNRSCIRGGRLDKRDFLKGSAATAAALMMGLNEDKAFADDSVPRTNWSGKLSLLDQ